jgi:ribosome-associated protein
VIIINKVEIKTPTIELDKFLKWAGVLSSGGEAKSLIQQGEVLVNGQVETHRSRKLADGDIVEFAGQRFLVSRELGDR